MQVKDITIIRGMLLELLVQAMARGHHATYMQQFWSISMASPCHNELAYVYQGIIHECHFRHSCISTILKRCVQETDVGFNCYQFVNMANPYHLLSSSRNVHQNILPKILNQQPDGICIVLMNLKKHEFMYFRFELIFLSNRFLLLYMCGV